MYARYLRLNFLLIELDLHLANRKIGIFRSSYYFRDVTTGINVLGGIYYEEDPH